MLKRENRFSFKKSIPKKIFATPNFVLRFEENNNESLRVAVIVGKKVDKRAVVRNRVKRMIITSIKDLLPTTKNLTLILYSKKPVLALTNDQIKESLEKAFTKIKLT